MNRRGFFGRLAALAAAVGLVKRKPKALTACVAIGPASPATITLPNGWTRAVSTNSINSFTPSVQIFYKEFTGQTSSGNWQGSVEMFRST